MSSPRAHLELHQLVEVHLVVHRPLVHGGAPHGENEEKHGSREEYIR
mgnify:CR=1 FL=1